ncbi:MAG: ATP-binding protein [Desulfobacteraceae bacterium]
MNDRICKYRMTLNLNVLNHLGINLYSNTPAVLSEVVANAWDADAENVEITVDDDNKIITISDDGHGMTIEDANNKFLNVGYRRRVEGVSITEKLKRPVMGRKGIGKLSLFSIAKRIEVYSVKDGEIHGFEMVLDDIRQQIEDSVGIYTPNELLEFPDDLKKGTRLVISEFKRNFSSSDIFLRRRLARRFSVIGDKFNFEIILNGKPIKISDRDYFNKVQFLWTYNDGGDIKKSCSNCENSDERNFRIDDKYEVSGWIGSVAKSGALKDSETGDNLNKIVVMVRGKVAQEDILEEFGEAGVYSKYLFGEIRADFLDDDNEEDIATSSRQKILEDDRRYRLLKDFIREELKNIQSKWTKLRNTEGTKKALEIPAIKEWYGSLGKDNKKKAKSLFGKINKLTIDSDNDRRSLLKHAIIAFESMKIKEDLDTLESLDGKELEAFVKIFEDMADMEATMYRQIVMSRIEVIRSLREKVAENAREKILQQHLYDHLWLLDPSWERADKTEYMEQQVHKEFDKIDASLSPEELKGRVDIKYRTTSGKHVIIELKRAERVVSSYDLMEQCDKYRNALKKILEATDKSNEPIEVVCVVGRPLKDWDNNPDSKEESIGSLEKKHIRVVLYQELIESAEKIYQAYLEKEKEAGRIYELVQKIDEVTTEEYVEV